MNDKSSYIKPKVLDELEKIANILPAPIYWEDTNSVILGGNEAVFQDTGARAREAYVGKTLYELYPKAMADHIKFHNEEVMRTGKILSQEEVIVDISTGEKKYFTAIKAPLLDDDGVTIGVVGTSIDITELKKTQEYLKIAKEQAESANEAKEEFLRNMRHDLRTPFSGILTLAELMVEDETDIKKRENLQDIADSAKVLLEYMNRILDNAQLGMKAKSVVSEPIQLEKLLKESLLTIAPTANAKNLQLKQQYVTHIPQIVLGDAWRLQRIIVNLLGNAVKFTEQGEITLGVDVLNETAEEIILSIWVSDTGIGIPEDKYENIFEKFTRLEAAYTGKYQGTGLGLHDVKYLCYELGGDINVSSEVNQGSLFTCMLPFVKAMHLQENLALPKSEAAKPASTTTYDRTVLLVEDQPIAVMTTERRLRAHGYVVDVAETGLLALEKFNTNKYDLILMDIGLPDIDGITVTQKIRHIEEINSLNKTPIFAVTAHPDHEEELAVFDRVFSKPFTPIIIDAMNALLYKAKSV